MTLVYVTVSGTNNVTVFTGRYCRDFMKYLLESRSKKIEELAILEDTKLDFFC